MEPAAPAPLDSALGKFDFRDARHLVDLLDAHEIPYAVKITAKPKWANQHQGTWIEIFVAEDRVQDGHHLAGTLFPPESEPVSRTWLVVNRPV